MQKQQPTEEQKAIAEKAAFQYASMLHLLQAGCPLKIGVPSWTVQYMLNRKLWPLTMEQVLGLDPEFAHCSPIIQHQNRVGYQFSWGTLTEDVAISEYTDDEEEVPYAYFEFFPEELLKKFPQAAMVEDIFMTLCEAHPEYDTWPEVEECSGDWYVLGFGARGEEEIEQVRQWLVNEFLPEIWPDMLANAGTMIDLHIENERRKNPGATVEDMMQETNRNQICGWVAGFVGDANEDGHHPVM